MACYELPRLTYHTNSYSALPLPVVCTFGNLKTSPANGYWQSNKRYYILPIMVELPPVSTEECAAKQIAYYTLRENEYRTKIRCPNNMRFIYLT